MPKVASSTEEEIIKAPRKRAPRRVTAPKAVRTTRTRVTKEVRVDDEVITERKAPTRLPDSPSRNRHFSFGTALKILIPLVVLGATVWIGFSDSGQIDVNAKINDRNTSVAAGDNASGMVHVPVQNAPTVPNGGLVGRGVLNSPTSPVPATEATSSDVTASTTEAGEATTTTTTTEGETPNVTDSPAENTEPTPPPIEDTNANPPVSS